MTEYPDFHDEAEELLQKHDTLRLNQTAKAYAEWRKTNPEPFEGADDEMAAIVEEHLAWLAAQRVAQ